MVEEIVKEPPNVNPSGRCSFWVKNKRRFCKMMPSKEHLYCGEHLTMATETHDRIPCPIDSTHTIFKSKLDQHLKRCNKRPSEHGSYYQANINLKTSQLNDEREDSDTDITRTEYEEHESLSGDKSNLNAVTDWKILIARIREIYKQINAVDASTLFDQREHTIVEAQLHEVGDVRQKHLRQHASMVAHLQDRQMLRDDHCYVEFGAGRAELSAWIAAAMAKEEMNGPSFLLIDRDTPRNKLDKYVKWGKSTGRSSSSSEILKNDASTTESRWQPNVARLSMDIKDLSLDLHEFVGKASGIVAYSKHLCGPATDLATQCVLKTKKPVSCFLVALCCHHRCVFDMYANPTFLTTHGIDSDLFQKLAAISAWATCAPNHPNRKRKFNDEAEVAKKETGHVSGLSLEEREEVGRMCKRILDQGRVELLHQNGFEVERFCYVDPSVSLENVAILAFLPPRLDNQPTACNDAPVE